MPSEEFPDEIIIQALLCGDKKKEEWAVKMLLKHYKAMAFDIVIRKGGGNEEEAGDILNDTVMAVIKAVKNGGYRPEKAGLGTYLYKIAQNKWLTQYRKNAARRQNEDQYARVYTLQESQESPAERIIREKELTGLIADALEKLDKNCYQVLKKFWFENKKHEKIAEELGITPDNARQRNHRCKEKLKKILGKDPRKS